MGLTTLIQFLKSKISGRSSPQNSTASDERERTIQEEHIEIEDSNIDQEKFHSLEEEIEELSASLSERAILKNMMKDLYPKLMFPRVALRKILLRAFKEYRDKTEIPIQKFAMLERSKRDKHILMLKNTIIEMIIPLVQDNIDKVLPTLEKQLDSFFQKYLEFY